MVVWTGFLKEILFCLNLGFKFVSFWWIMAKRDFNWEISSRYCTWPVRSMHAIPWYLGLANHSLKPSIFIAWLLLSSWSLLASLARTAQQSNKNVTLATSKFTTCEASRPVRRVTKGIACCFARFYWCWCEATRSRSAQFTCCLCCKPSFACEGSRRAQDARCVLCSASGWVTSAKQ